MTDNTNLVEAVRRLVKAKGRYHTEQNYKAVVDALDSYDAARRASPKESEGQRQSGLPGALKTPETRMDTGFEGGHLASARSEGLELPPLPEPKYAADDLTDIFTADQVQQYAREAVEADRRARAVAHISEMAQWARDNGLNVPVEWSSRAQQPAPAASIGDDAKLAEARRVPCGYVLLPKVPTKDMLRAGMPMFLERREPATAAWQTWNRMIAAAPAPGKEGA